MQEIDDKTLLWDEQIDRFLCNEMTAEEENDFLKQVQADRDMREYVAAMTLLIHKTREQGRETDRSFLQAISQTSEDDIDQVVDIVKSSRFLCASIASDGHDGPELPLPPFVNELEDGPCGVNELEDGPEVENVSDDEPPTSKKSKLYIIITPVIAIAACACAFFGNSYLLKASAIEYAESAGVDFFILPRGGESPEYHNKQSNLEAGKESIPTVEQLRSIFASLPAMDTAEYRTVGWHLALAHIKDGDISEAQAVLQQVIKVCPDFKEARTLNDKLSRTFFWQ